MPPVPAHSHQSYVPKNLEVLGDRGLFHSQSYDYVGAETVARSQGRGLWHFR